VSAPQTIDRLLIVTLLGEQATALVARLTGDGFYATEVNSTGGLLQDPQVSLLVGFDRGRQEKLLAHIRDCCRRHRRFIAAHLEGSSSLFQPAIIEAEVGGAVVYALDVERFERL
jgi:uncharacterized protein YaaQ